MWDHLEFLVPNRGYNFSYDDPVVAEAIELIGKNRCPNNEEKLKAHAQIEDLVTRPHLPDVFYYRGSDPYEVYPQKFLNDTWDLLVNSKFAGSLLPNDDYRLSKQAGFAIMAILADACAGTTRTRVTDSPQSYASLTDLLKDNARIGVRERLVDMSVRAIPRGPFLVGLRLSLPDIDYLSLDKLIEFRKREAVETGNSLRKLRHGFLERIERRVEDLTNHGLTRSDREELERLFFREALDDLAEVTGKRKKQNRGVLRDIILTAVTTSAELLTGAPVLPGVRTLSGAPVKLRGAIASRNQFVKARTEIIRDHPMALLHELSR